MTPNPKTIPQHIYIDGHELLVEFRPQVSSHFVVDDIPWLITEWDAYKDAISRGWERWIIEKRYVVVSHPPPPEESDPDDEDPRVWVLQDIVRGHGAVEPIGVYTSVNKAKEAVRDLHNMRDRRWIHRLGDDTWTTADDEHDQYYEITGLVVE